MRPIALLAPALLIGALAGCATPAPADDGTLSVVASTDVYGSIAEAVGGDLVTVTSIISGAAQDPHSYEASAQDSLALSKADVVIENGGGYDPFIDQLIEASGSQARVLTAVADEEHEAEHGAEEEADHEGEADHEAEDDGHGHIEGFNEHVWYDLGAAEEVAEHLGELLGEIDTANAATYTANAEAFIAEIDALEDRAESLATSIGGQGVAVTEPVPLYLLEEVGLVNHTPEAFTEAIEEGADVPPVALQETLDVIASGEIALLAYNSQTASGETERVREAAEAAGIPVVDFTETLPDGQDYLSWMTANLDAIEAALL